MIGDDRTRGTDGQTASVGAAVAATAEPLPPVTAGEAVPITGEATRITGKATRPAGLRDGRSAR